MIYGATSVGGLEIPLSGLVKSAPFYLDLNRVIKQALHVYEVFKVEAQRSGHTFLYENKVTKSYNWLLGNNKSHRFFALPIDKSINIFE